MPYIAICHDRCEANPVRLRSRELQAHLAYIDTIRDKVLVAGPFTTGHSTAYNASLFIYAADTEKEARRLLENDPYFRTGLYENVTIAPFTPARGSWLTSVSNLNSDQNS